MGVKGVSEAGDIVDARECYGNYVNVVRDATEGEERDYIIVITVSVSMYILFADFFCI